MVAPAGSGKSVLMSQWAEAREDLAIAWVDLTSASADPIVLARQLVEALDDAAPGALEDS